MRDLLSTLDLLAGDYVMRSPSSALVQVAEITEPTHPAMPGLVVRVHYYRPDERRYDDVVRSLHSTDPARPEWVKVPADLLPMLPDERYDVPDGMHAWRYADEITVRQTRLSGYPEWPTNGRGMNRLARDFAAGHDAFIRMTSNSLFGVGRREIWERRYRLA